MREADCATSREKRKASLAVSGFPRSVILGLVPRIQQENVGGASVDTDARL
jgi:hypothetical protein